jgi:hypothetical protein
MSEVSEAVDELTEEQAKKLVALLVEQRDRLVEIVKAHPYCNVCGSCEDMEIIEEMGHADETHGYVHVACSDFDPEDL